MSTVPDLAPGSLEAFLSAYLVTRHLLLAQRMVGGVIVWPSCAALITSVRTVGYANIEIVTDQGRLDYWPAHPSQSTCMDVLAIFDRNGQPLWVQDGRHAV